MQNKIEKGIVKKCIGAESSGGTFTKHPQFSNGKGSASAVLKVCCAADGYTQSADDHNEEYGRAGQCGIEIYLNRLRQRKLASLVAAEIHGGRKSVLQKSHRCDLGASIQLREPHDAHRALERGPSRDCPANENRSTTDRQQQECNNED